LPGDKQAAGHGRSAGRDPRLEAGVRQTVERVRGFYDVDVASQQQASAVIRSLMESFRLAGFQPIDVPIVEHLDLYLRKNGAQVLPKIYAFVDQGKRELALRPEFTASVIRALAPGFNRQSAALHVAYAGPVFRYEKPQRATGRQFTQAGVELLGDAGPLADAELLALACRSAHALGIERIRLVIGHLAPLRALLGFLEVDGYAEHYLLEHLEYFNRGAQQQIAVRKQLGLLALEATTGQEDDEALAQSLASAVRDATPEEARRLVAAILDQMGLDLSGSTRTPEEILDRVLIKARRRAAQHAGRWRENLERALIFVERLGELRGEPAAVLAQTEDMLRQYDVPLSALDEMRAVLDALMRYDLPGVTIELAPGMARGIAYYSGLIFELYAGAPDGVPLQICGGGRYDGLAQALTGRPCPALGFAFGVERLLHVLPEQPSRAGAPPRLALIVMQPSWLGVAQPLATAIRARSLACAVYAVERSFARTLEQAEQAGYAAAIVLPGPAGAPTLHVWQEAALDAETRAALVALVETAGGPEGVADRAAAQSSGNRR
ncbi:MAG TPA: HisS family protein, partial [Chloroflexota bacterium]|nr:HisS family protein [Chloroflexota bacterium]